MLCRVALLFLLDSQFFVCAILMHTNRKEKNLLSWEDGAVTAKPQTLPRTIQGEVLCMDLFKSYLN